tara:strand:+ start:35 stop:475 length:441 start_codon:yes stop_codon:yes gene_type:complete
MIASKYSTKTVTHVRHVSRKPMKVMCSAVKTKTDSSSVNYLQFAETINGRCAMQGFIWGSVKEALNHESIMQQVITKVPGGTYDVNSAAALEFSAVVALVTLGTVFTSVVKDASEYQSNTFTNEAELVNARLAMVGFLFLSMIHFQ